ncbi:MULTISPECIES: diguanylate cyclase [unclassified Sphingobium]|uniref:sensor domain-containing diguanylate cyclase n=1 Tax=unclassified Sphingobium TaxID=2611147 RepID=UPI002224D442|nr:MULTISPECIES: diguanylate cyclase [unclassified Sphingobium]MCW2381547.1 diguanylate cyclase (GGDEF)-like protein [Sphingobium sp. B2D3B]MCW2398346.1 diguanylate cyclase (GGDEF)-like protein [Sphingobium sp. B2D3C]
MGQSQRQILYAFIRHAGLPVLAGLGYFVISYATISLKTTNGMVAPVWIANAFLLALVLARPARQAPALIMAGMVANVLSGLPAGNNLQTALVYGLANGLEIAVAVAGLKLHRNGAHAFSDPEALPHVLIWAGLVGPACGAFLGGIGAWANNAHPLSEAYARWFLADALGLLIFTPVFLAMFNGEMRRSLASQTRRRRLEVAALLALTAGAAGVAFFSTESSHLLLVVPPMLLVLLRSGWMATKIALAIVTVIGGAAMMGGYGSPVMHSHHAAHHLYGIQMFIALLIVVQVPISAMLASRQATIERMRQNEQSLNLLASASPVLLLAFNLEGVCTRVVGTRELLLDRAFDALIGAGLSDISEEGQYELTRAHSAALEDVSTSQIAEFRTLKLRDAWMEATFRAHFDESGRCIGTIATVQDITQRKKQELWLSRTATTDSLTGLLNRAGFHQRLEQALVKATPGTLSLAVIDIDRFKLINDNSGHQMGDTVLREIACRISSQVRASDAVGRMGGDEFVVLLATSNWDRVQEICGRIVSAVSSEPIALPSGNSLRAAISCGVVRYRQGQSAEDFIHEADIALYQAKRGGRNRVVAA